MTLVASSFVSGGGHTTTNPAAVPTRHVALHFGTTVESLMLCCNRKRLLATVAGTGDVQPTRPGVINSLVVAYGRFSQGAFGPFRAGIPVEVPMWLAARLKQEQKCSIVCPTWMTAGAMEE